MHNMYDAHRMQYSSSFSFDIVYNCTQTVMDIFHHFCVCSLILLQNAKVNLLNALTHSHIHKHALTHTYSSFKLSNLCWCLYFALLCFTFLLFNETPEAENMNRKKN